MNYQSFPVSPSRDCLKDMRQPQNQKIKRLHGQQTKRVLSKGGKVVATIIQSKCKAVTHLSDLDPDTLWSITRSTVAPVHTCTRPEVAQVNM